MAIQDGEDILAEDFINESERDAVPSVDANRVPKLESTQMIHPVFIGSIFMTDGSDGDLIISSGITNIDCAGAKFVVRNYKDISITGSAQLTFSNPHQNGTTIIILCNNFTATTSANPAVNCSGMGAQGGAGFTTFSQNVTNSGQAGFGSHGFSHVMTDGGDNGAGSQLGGVRTIGINDNRIISAFTGILNWFSAGAGGGAGEVRTGSVGTQERTAGSGGRGGGALAVFCAGNWDVTANISVAGQNGTDYSGSTSNNDAIGAGGGGGGGTFFAAIRRIVTNSGSIVTSGGIGGIGKQGSSGAPQARGGGGGSSVFADGANGTQTNVSNLEIKIGGNGGAGRHLLTTNDVMAT